MSYKDKIEEIHKDGRKPTKEEYRELGAQIWMEWKEKIKNIFKRKKEM